jgi:hypothetical protein
LEIPGAALAAATPPASEVNTRRRSSWVIVYLADGKSRLVVQSAKIGDGVTFIELGTD